jgi:hypothetical protein
MDTKIDHLMLQTFSANNCTCRFSHSLEDLPACSLYSVSSMCKLVNWVIELSWSSLTCFNSVLRHSTSFLSSSSSLIASCWDAWDFQKLQVISTRIFIICCKPTCTKRVKEMTIIFRPYSFIKKIMWKH